MDEPVDRRARRIAETCELVLRIMNLRPPQAEALRRIAGLLRRLPRSLSDCTAEERLAFLTEASRWTHTAHPTFTISLATGVGKTRLAGAIIALLFLAKEARTFLILAPRRAVLRRFADAFDPSFREYIFVEPGFVPEPYVISGDQIADPVAVEAVPDMFKVGPTIYLLSPQLISTSDRFLRPQAFTGISPADHVRAKRDLVVIVDEAHHVGGLAKSEAAKWTEAIRNVEPSLQLGLTATPRGEEGENLLYNYPLAQALIERLYTKDVHLLVRNFDGSPLPEEDIDKATIRYALDRLSIKENSLWQCSTPPFPNVKPVCVFFARDIAHAEWVSHVLAEEHELPAEQILVTHSRASKSEEAVESLLSIEEERNPIRVVVNVQELTEGWDVRNVYVVAPLRAMATFVGALQAMGRGLRLPAGVRVQHPELDSLDVICFGKQSLQTIVQQATRWLGREGGEVAGGLLVDSFESGIRTAVPVAIPATLSVAPIVLEELEPRHEEISVAIDVTSLKRSAKMAVDDLDLVRLKSRFVRDQAISVSRDSFISAATLRVLRVASNYLSDDIHFDVVRGLIEEWLSATGVKQDRVEFDPSEIGEDLGQLIVDAARKRVLDYQRTGRQFQLTFPEYQGTIVVSHSPNDKPTSATTNDFPITRKSDFAKGLLVRGLDDHAWEHGVHPAYAFDSFPEVRLAWLLDHAQEIEWWARNEPRRLRVPTAAGSFYPDFLVRLVSGDLLILEAKGATYWSPPDSEERVKAAAATKWVAAQTALGRQRWRFGVVLDTDIESASSFGLLLERSQQL